MRIAIHGTCNAAVVLRGLIQRDNCLILDAGTHADLNITIDEGSVNVPTIDGIDGTIEMQIHRQIGLHSPSKCVMTQFVRGKDATDKDIRIIVPANSPAESYAVERGVYQGLLKAADVDGTPRRRRFLGLLSLTVGLIAVSATVAEPQSTNLQLADALAELHMTKTRIAQLEVALVEKDRQLAVVQYRTGMNDVESRRKLLEADGAAAECQLTARAGAAIERLRVLERPESGSVYDMSIGRWARPEKEKPR